MKLTVSTSFPAPPMYVEERERSDKKLKTPEEFYTITDKGRAYIMDHRTTAEKIRDCREKHYLGLEFAKRIVLRDELRIEINRAETVEDIKRILLEVFPALDHSEDY